jgi:hypothetical protein
MAALGFAKRPFVSLRGAPFVSVPAGNRSRRGSWLAAGRGVRHAHRPDGALIALPDVPGALIPDLGASVGLPPLVGYEQAFGPGRHRR